MKMPSEPASPEPDPAFERWLREAVVPTYDATMADPSSRIPAKAAFAEARARYAGQRKVDR